jgi:hypothetical protein
MRRTVTGHDKMKSPSQVGNGWNYLSFHPLADIFPMMDEAALAELAADIKAESQREPIYSGTIAAPSDGGSIPSDWLR